MVVSPLHLGDNRFIEVRDLLVTVQLKMAGLEFKSRTSGLPIQAFPSRAGAGKLPPATHFHVAYELRKVFTFINGWGKR